MVNLIINADDFGFDIARNDAILDCFKNNQISTTTIMANMPGFEDGVKRVFENGLQNRVGLHLNFTQGMPLTDDIKRFPVFCNADGTFNAKFHRSKINRLILSKENQLAILKEAEAQMRRYTAVGFTLMHMDSHHHSHTDPVICRIVCPLAKKYGFNSIRLSRNFHIQGLLKKLYKRYVNKIIKENSNCTTDIFLAFSDIKKNWQKLLKMNKTVEVMVHPNYHNCGEGLIMCDFRDNWDSISTFLDSHKHEYSLMTFLDLNQR